MAHFAATARRPVPAELYEELQDFYAKHMRHRDEGNVDGWLEAFDENAESLTNVFAQQAKHGREALATAVRELDAKFLAAGLLRRHLLSTFLVVPQEDDTVHTRYYALVLTTKPGERTTVHSTSVANDVLVRTENGWRVTSRTVVRDDLPK